MWDIGCGINVVASEDPNADGEVTEEIDNYNAGIDGGSPTGEANISTDYNDGNGTLAITEVP